jgi:tetratricopeptide (TPR) repeat protein
MSRYCVVFIALTVATFLGPYNVWSQTQHRIDSLKRGLVHAPPDSNRTRLSLQIGQHYYDQYKVARKSRGYSKFPEIMALLDSAIGYARQVASLVSAAKQLPQKAEALYLLAECYSFGESYDSIRTINYYQQAVKAYKQLGDKPNTAKVLHNYADIVRLRVGAKKALPLFMEELAIQQSYGIQRSTLP